ncbi:DNA N-6-adenine-methyltransferase [Bifidobacterium castoris]|uniref:Phage N-6-adenine-methyltransferase (Dam methylase) n=1 Tax=Bifidobacterium castoris TaxID=2306972 RepID=A0A430FAA4_9BIFI|nr:DNA N-6-adenine-methyltransferase [Bifidobacterium castoris]RSX49756.1 phage N-6-adenine-methyltransferase (Dam methylase) [Bifidobacterium castoris]
MSDFYTAGGAALTSDKDDWETPQALFEQLDAEFHFTLDAASNDRNTKCVKHYTREDSAFNHSWEGETVFCNPPYGRHTIDWIRKCSQEASRPDTLVVLLVPARTDTKWFQQYILNRAEIRFLPGRLKYEIDGHPGQAAPFPSMIVIMRTGER